MPTIEELEAENARLATALKQEQWAHTRTAERLWKLTGDERDRRLAGVGDDYRITSIECVHCGQELPYGVLASKSHEAGDDA